MDILKRVKNFWQKNIQEEDLDIVIACSGGVDSMAMTDILQNLAKDLRLRIHVAHFDHGIRGEASKRDRKFVQEFCKERNLSFFFREGDIPKLAKEEGISLETAARKYRYAFLREIASQYSHSLIATAHHQDDQSETILLHLLRGSGLRGLGGILPKNGDIVRPLLFLSKDELMAYCQAENISYCHDETNDEKEYTRNRIRLELLPYLKDHFNPRIRESLNQLSTIVAEEEELMDSLAREAYKRLVKKNERGREFSCASFKGEQLAIKRRILQLLLEELGGEVSFKHIESLLELIAGERTGSYIYLNKDLRGIITYGIFKLEKNIYFSKNNGTIYEENSHISVKVPGITTLPDGAIVEVTTEKPAKGDYFALYDFEAGILPGELFFRRRRPGDRVNLGKYHKKLKDFLIDLKLPREQRDYLWLLCYKDEILWIPKVRKFAYGNEKKKVIYITYKDEGAEKEC